MITERQTNTPTNITYLAEVIKPIHSMTSVVPNIYMPKELE